MGGKFEVAGSVAIEVAASKVGGLQAGQGCNLSSSCASCWLVRGSLHLTERACRCLWRRPLAAWCCMPLRWLSQRRGWEGLRGPKVRHMQRCLCTGC